MQVQFSYKLCDSVLIRFCSITDKFGIYETNSGIIIYSSTLYSNSII